MTRRRVLVVVLAVALAATGLVAAVWPAPQTRRRVAS
jgi:hypothetical protein